ncbi:MAG: outer membrane beta-barrel protein, partial [Nitrospiraceae bacterium]
APVGGNEASDSFVEGIQARRANSSTNTGRVEASFAASPVLSFISTYRDQRREFGQAQSTPTGVVQGSLIDTTFQTVTSGPEVKISPVDTASLFYQYQKGTYRTSDFSTQGALAGWTRSITPTLTAGVTGGATVFSTSNDLRYLGSAFLSWEGEDSAVNVSYSRRIVPSFYVAATALLSQVVTATVTHRVTKSLALSLNSNYAHNQSVPDSSVLTFESYAVTPSVTYKINRVMTATLSYTHSQYQRTFSSQEFVFNRNMVILGLVAEWE